MDVRYCPSSGVMMVVHWMLLYKPLLPVLKVANNSVVKCPPLCKEKEKFYGYVKKFFKLYLQMASWSKNTKK